MKGAGEKFSRREKNGGTVPGLLASGPNRGRACPNPAKYPEDNPVFCGKHAGSESFAEAELDRDVRAPSRLPRSRAGTAEESPIDLPDYINSLGDAEIAEICWKLVEGERLEKRQLASLASLIRSERRIRDICQPILQEARKRLFPESCYMWYVDSPLHRGSRNRLDERFHAIQCGDMMALFPLYLEKQETKNLAALFPKAKQLFIPENLKGYSSWLAFRKMAESELIPAGTVEVSLPEAIEAFLWLGQRLISWKHEAETVNVSTQEFMAIPPKCRMAMLTLSSIARFYRLPKEGVSSRV